MEWFKISACCGILLIGLLFAQLAPAESISSELRATDRAAVSNSEQKLNTTCEWSRIGGKRLLHCDSGETLARRQHRETLAKKAIEVEKVIETEKPEQPNPRPDKIKRPEPVRELPTSLAQEKIESTEESNADDTTVVETTVVEIAPDKSTLDDSAVVKKITDVKPPNPMGFMVVGKQDVEHFIEMLDAGSIPEDEVDYMRLRKAPFEGKVSFGIYSYEAFAEVRRAELRTYGIESVIVNRLDATKDRIAKID